MKNIKKIIFIALLAIFAVACTNEDDFNANSSGTTFNKKNAIQGDNNRPYPEYEMKDYSDAETKAMLEHFDKVVNDPSSTISDMPIEKALYIMEAYINYGVIDKANSVATEPNTENRTFTFTTPIESGNVIGTELKDRFQDFAVNLLRTMRGKALSLSDMYVIEISSTSVTFGLDIMPVPPGPGYVEPRYFFPEFYKTGDNIVVPAGIESPWSRWYHFDHATDWEPWPLNPTPLPPLYELIPTEVTEHNVYRYSMKPIGLRYNFTHNTYFTYYTGIKRPFEFTIDYYSKYTDMYGVVPTHNEAYYDNLGIQNILIPKAFELLDEIAVTVTTTQGGRIICDYIPHIFYRIVDQGNPYDAIHMYIHSVTVGFKHVEQPQMHYVTALNIADIHPEL